MYKKNPKRRYAPRIFNAYNKKAFFFCVLPDWSMPQFRKPLTFPGSAGVDSQFY